MTIISDLILVQHLQLQLQIKVFNVQMANFVPQVLIQQFNFMLFFFHFSLVIL